MDTKKVFAIVIALEEGKFDYYLSEPKTFYEIRAEAVYVMEQLLQERKINKSQIKIVTLWKIKPKTNS